MGYPLRFQVLISNRFSWDEVLGMYLQAEEYGIDLAGSADHFVNWKHPEIHWMESWAVLAAVAANTSKLRIGPLVAQIPLRNPAMFARQALTVDHISNGRLELALGIGLPSDPSYEVMGIPNWSNKERVDRFPEYLEIVDGLLSNETTTFLGQYYQVNEAIMNPRPVQSPRPPITIAAMGPRMLGIAAKYADTWNSMSFVPSHEEQIQETQFRMSLIDEKCKEIGRDPGSLRRSTFMFDPGSFENDGKMDFYASEEIFVEKVMSYIDLGITDIGLFYPHSETEVPMYEHIAKNVMPQLKEEFSGI